jgi:hypothetical protein
MKMFLRLLIGLALLLGAEQADAVPSFAPKAGLSCNVCHSDAPELTAFGRSFKLNGYIDKVSLGLHTAG